MITIEYEGTKMAISQKGKAFKVKIKGVTVLDEDTSLERAISKGKEFIDQYCVPRTTKQVANEQE